MKFKKNVPGIRKLQIVQLLLTLVFSLIAWVMAGNKAGFSALCGGLIALIPSIIFAKILFKHKGARAARQIVRNFYIGELLKILSSIVLFVLVFSTYYVQPVAFFLTYIVVVMTHWVSPLLIDNQRNRPKSD